MRFTELSSTHQRALIRLVLTNPYLRQPEQFANAVERALGFQPSETPDSCRRLRYAVYKHCGLASEGQGWVSLLITSMDKLFAAATKAWGDGRLSGPRRTAAIGVREDGRLFFLGGPKDRLARRAGWVLVSEDTNGWTAGWQDCPGESTTPLEPEERSRASRPPLSSPQAVPLSLETLMPLVLRAMRSSSVTHIEVTDDPNLGPRVHFTGSRAISMADGT